MSNLPENIAYLNRLHPDVDLRLDMTLQELEQRLITVNVTLENAILFRLELKEMHWEKLHFIFLDVDGVMTEGGMHYTDSGDEFKRFDTKDGMAIKVAMQHDLQFGIISSGVNRKILAHRADMFGIKHLYVGTEPKLTIAEQWMNDLGIDWSQTAYIGDDINDLQMFERVGFAACPADATDPIKRKASVVLKSKGGHGCIREFLKHHPRLSGLL